MTKIYRQVCKIYIFVLYLPLNKYKHIIITKQYYGILYSRVYTVYIIIV